MGNLAKKIAKKITAATIKDSRLNIFLSITFIFVDGFYSNWRRLATYPSKKKSPVPAGTGLYCYQSPKNIFGFLLLCYRNNITVKQTQRNYSVMNQLNLLLMLLQWLLLLHRYFHLRYYHRLLQKHSPRDESFRYYQLIQKHSLWW